MDFEEQVDAQLKWVDDWEASARAMAEQAREFARAVQPLTGVAQSKDGIATATVDSRGHLIDMELDLEEESPKKVAEAVLEAYEAASDDLARRVRNLGHGSPSSERYAKTVSTPVSRDDGEGIWS